MKVRPKHLQPTPRSEQVKKRAQSAMRHVSVCSYCHRRGEPFVVKGDPDGNFWCMDHIVPLHKCGEDALHNLTKSCWACNEKKGASLWQRRLEGKEIETANNKCLVWNIDTLRAANPRFAKYLSWVTAEKAKRKKSRQPRQSQAKPKKPKWVTIEQITTEPKAKPKNKMRHFNDPRPSVFKGQIKLVK